jgi:L-lactate dehydrogenase (cytochrome)
MSHSNEKKLVSMDVVRKGASANKSGAWIVIKGKAYNFTDFARNHPGGGELLLKNNGKDATAEFEASHPVDIISRTITPEQYEVMFLGDVNPASVKTSDLALYNPDENDEPPPQDVHGENENIKPSIDTCLNLYDFEAIASRTMKKSGWAYYSSGADDEITLRENHSAFHRIWLRPRVMVNVKKIDMTSELLGFPTSLPLYLSAAAMCKLGHADGEVAWTRACGSEGIVQMIPTLSSCSLDDIMGARIEGQNCFFQLYVNSNRDTCREIVEKAERLGCKAMFITCDAPQLGNREKDRRVKVSHSGASVQGGKATNKKEGTSKLLTTFIDPSLCWDDIKWFRSITKMKIVLKGIATAEDALKAHAHGIKAIVCSNHGGRQLDFARSGIEILPEVMAALREKGIEKEMEVYVDGGVRRGTDIFKALAMGAKAVGLSRPALYAMSAFGQEGIEKMIQILKDELEMTMRLMGTPTIADIRGEMVVTQDLGRHNTIPKDWLQQETYLPKATQATNSKFVGRRAENSRLDNYVQSKHDSREIQSLRKEVRELKQLIVSLAKSGKSSSTDSPNVFSIGTFIVMFSAVLSAIFSTIFAIDSRMSVHRTAIFLISYLVVHVCGNLTIFLGPGVFNDYADMLNNMWIIKCIEYYLFIAFILHIVTASYRQYKIKVMKGITRAPVSVLKRMYLLITGLLIVAFLYMHLQHFRFNEHLEEWKTTDGKTNFYAVMQNLFEDNTMGMFYIFGVVTVGIHLYVGWGKAVHKMHLDKAHGTAQYLNPVRRLGQVLAVLVTVGFIACILQVS